MNIISAHRNDYFPIEFTFSATDLESCELFRFGLGFQKMLH